VRRILLLVAAVLWAAPAASVTLDFESVPGKTPVAYEPGASVPETARLSSLDLPGGGQLVIKTRDGSKYVALVTHLGATSIVAVKGGKISTSRYVELRFKGAKGVQFDSMMLLPAGVRRGDNPATPAVETDFVLGYDNSGGAQYVLRSSGDFRVSASLSRFRDEPRPLLLNTFPEPIISVLLGGNVTIGDVVISGGAAPTMARLVPEPSATALLAAGALALVWRAQRARSR
jgi:hypothetical protein